MNTRMFLCRVISILVMLTMLVGTIVVYAEESGLSDEQRNAISMLNYVTVLTQDINASKNSRLYVEEAYSTLINNTNPNAVDNRTLSQLTGLLDIMENYRMISVKRERLQFIYEQNQAQAMRAAIPNPLGLMSAVHSGNLIQLAASVAYMAVDSVSSYKSYTREADLQYIQDGWALDDEEANTIHESRKGIFSFMVKMVQDYKLPEDITLTESTVDEYVKWKNNENITARIQFLESNRKTYQNYSGYWLLLAESYYKNGDYQKCLDSIMEYEKNSTRIFRRDHDLAKTLPLAIAAAGELYGDDDYVAYASEKARIILNNTDHNDWALRYFVAQTYVDLNNRTAEDEYLEAAYSVALDNVNYLVDQQKALNATYLADVVETPVPKDASKDEKTQISNYNRMLKEQRKAELPPVYEPLLLNTELLFGLAAKKEISDAEKAKINGILHPYDNALFLTAALDSLYGYDRAAIENEETNIDFAGTAIKIPAVDVSDGTAIIVTITAADGKQEEYSDWSISSVSRGKNKSIDQWEAIYTSDTIKKHDWKPEDKISIAISPKAGSSAEDIVISYNAVGTKNAWYDYLKVWEGYSSEWYDYLKVWDNKVRFERIEE